MALALLMVSNDVSFLSDACMGEVSDRHSNGRYGLSHTSVTCITKASRKICTALERDRFGVGPL